MSDLFHKDVPDEFIEKVFAVMCKAKQHNFQVLTKRPARMMTWAQQYCSQLPPHIWLGVSVENQNFVGRIRQLQQTPAQIRFLSIEPLLGPIALDQSLLSGIHWVIAGGESGHGARPMQVQWVRDIRDVCAKHQVPFFFKQWGAFDSNGMFVGKKDAGRILDGRTWDEELKG